MSSKLKKWIIAGVVFLLVAVGVLLGVSMLSKLSTTTVYDLRLLDYESEKEIFEKEVYLTALENNNFNIKVESSSSSIVNFVVYSSDTSVASVSTINDGYKVSYYKKGSAVITVSCEDGGNVKDSFVLTVKENVPTTFVITDEEAVSENEVNIFADDRDYYFNFKATVGLESSYVNLTSLEVVDNYNKDVFEDIHIDDANSRLIIKAKQSDSDVREYITLFAKYTDENGNTITGNLFTVCINVYGNYISNIQLILSETPNFDNANNIYGNGLKLEGENEVSSVYLTPSVNVVYAKVRIVYTNGEIFDVTKDTTSKTTSGTPSTTTPSVGDYFAITLAQYSDTNNGGAVVLFIYQGHEVSFVFNFVDPTYTPASYENFVNRVLYKKVVVDDVEIYEYVYWDTRYMRDDAITDVNGNIIGFTGGNPETGA